MIFQEDITPIVSTQMQLGMQLPVYFLLEVAGFSDTCCILEWLFSPVCVAVLCNYWNNQGEFIKQVQIVLKSILVFQGQSLKQWNGTS